MMTRIAGVLVAVATFAGACSNTSQHDQPDARQADAAPPRPDAATPDGQNAAEPQLPAGSPVAIPLASVAALTYTGTLAFGGQHQAVIVDTGSTSLGVAASACTNCGVTPLYAPGSGAVDQQQTAMSQYADGTGWSGEIYQDTPALGDAPAVAVKFAAISSSNGFFRSFDGTGTIGYQGILGLGPDGALVTGTTSYLSSVIAGGMLGEIAFQLCNDGGTMWMGGYDPSKQAAPQAVVAMSNEFPAYLVGVSDMAVAGASLHQTVDAFGPTIIDTGTSIAFIPTAPLTALTNAIESSAGFQAAFSSQHLQSGTGCVTTSMTAAELDATLPPLAVSFPGVEGGTSPYANVAATHSYLVYSGDDEWCYGFADATELTGGQFTLSLFGDSLLSGYITTFDVADQRMGFAPQTGCDEANVAHVVRHTVEHVPGVAWWKQDPRVRVPSPAEIQRRVRQIGNGTRR
ncbi:MAG TPA: pepsin-like aspartic protease [Kofleriaceae bacterium]|jgi:hypothetical protein